MATGRGGGLIFAVAQAYQPVLTPVMERRAFRQMLADDVVG